MNIDWAHFTPFASLAGGLILGLASAIFILVNGRILGISGILGGLLPPKVADSLWRVAFLAGMFCAPMVFNAFAPVGFASPPRVDADLLTARIGKHERVDAVVVRESMPKTMIGKLDRKALRAEAGG